ncbi:phage/plasmid primase, P4 family [Arthrobacter sp. GMC3]|uniref:DNA primase family protein n=1 Tax=Arthrobacter sp. GMC3 TaxID=2058894 RepID=UPI000CE38D02|nr:phage/plasmid primase, P4 family [Arthrobacter sp. GMC3]
MTETNGRPVGDESALKAFGGTDSHSIAEQTESLKDIAMLHRGQVRIAHEFAASNVSEHMHVTGMGWFVWTGSHWAEDAGDKKSQNSVMATIRLMAGYAIGDKELLGDLVKSQSANGIKGVLQLASSLPGIAVHADELDADPHLLNCANGTLDLHEHKLRPHDPTDRITKVCRAAYDPSRTASLWNTFLEKSLPDAPVRGYFQRFGGLALIGKVLEHVFTIATGEGRNGKGVAYIAIAHALGDYCLIADPSLFEQVKSNPNAASPAFLALRGARFVVLSETAKTAKVDAALMKRLTGGDPITARSLYEKRAVTFLPSHTSLLVTNHLPTLPADDPAVWDRTRVIPFDVVIPPGERDTRLGEKLELEADGILTWMVQGLAAYQANGLGEPEEVLKATSKYAKSQDKVSLFIEEICTDSPANGGDTTMTLHDAYMNWAASEGIAKPHLLGSTDFGHALDKLGYTKKKTNRGAVRTGLGLEGSGLIVQLAQPQPRTGNTSGGEQCEGATARHGVPYSK